MTTRCCSTLPWNRALRMVGDPVDVVTGAQTFFETDFRLRGDHIPISWTRHYDSRRHQVDRGIGHGFRHSFDVELRFDLDGMCFVNGEGEAIEFPFVDSDGDSLLRGGHLLERLGPHHYRVHPPGDSPAWEFRFERDVVAKPSSLLLADNSQPPVRLQYERGLLLSMQLDAIRRVAFEYAGTRLVGAVLLESGSPSKYRLVRYQYDAPGRLTDVEDAYGGNLHYEYDADHRLVRSTDRRGYSFLFAYDNEGRCIHTRGEDGVEEYRFEYKAAERMTVATRGDGAVTRYFFDEADNLVQIIDPCGGLTAFLKDEEGRLVTEVDPNGNRSEILYDVQDLPYAKRDPSGHVRMLPADDTLHPLSHLLPESPVEWEHGDWPGPIDIVPDDVPLAKWLPPWVAKLWGANPTTAFPEIATLTDVQGLPIRDVRKDGKTRRWAYDSNGYVRWSTDLDGRTTRYEYGSWNHLLREVDPQGSIVQYSYTASEQIASVTDSGGTRSDYGYDHKDRLIEVRRHGKVRERYAYDAADNLIQKLDGEGKSLLTFTIAPGNLMKQRILASGDVQNFEYAKDGRLIGAENRTGSTTQAYDLCGRRVSDERDGKGVRHRFEADRLTETTVLGRFKTRYVVTDEGAFVVLDPAGGSLRLRLRGPGLIERSSSNDIDELAHYDPSGRCLLKAAEGPGLTGGWARRFVYSGEGDLVRRDDSLRGTTHYTHDEAHRLSKVILPSGEEQEYGYDRAGNLLRAPGLNASMQAGNRLRETHGERFAYNARDHVYLREGSGGRTVYTYDSRDLLVGIDGPGLAYQAMHDGLGRRTTKTVNGETWHFYWDTDRLAAEISPHGRLRLHVYPDALSLVPMLFLDYDSVEADPGSGRRYHLFTDHLGCPELVVDDGGTTVWRARIDPYGVTHVEIGESFHQPLRWPGHYFDAETGLHENRFRSYSPELGRYLQSDPSGTEGGLNLYAYTDNPLREVDLQGLAKSCPAHVKNCPHRNQGGKDKEGPPLKSVSKTTRKLAASNKNTRAARRARAKVVREFLKQYGKEWDPKTKSYKPPNNRQIRDQMKGHDLSRPIKVGPPPAITKPQTQYQGPAGHQGSYYTDKGTTPDQAGIASYTRNPDGTFVQKTPKEYKLDPKAPYLESTCAPCTDDWSVKGIDVPTNGGGTQRVVGDRGSATPI